MRNGMMRKVPEKRRHCAAAIGLLVFVVTLFQPLPALATCVFEVTASTIDAATAGSRITVGFCNENVSTGVTILPAEERLPKRQIVDLLRVPCSELSCVAIDNATGVVTVTLFNPSNTSQTTRLEVVPSLLSDVEISDSAAGCGRGGVGSGKGRYVALATR